MALTKIVVSLPDSFDGIKLPPQAIAILKTLENREYTVAEMVAHINSIAQAGELETRQKPWRIFQYYRAKFIENGFVKLEA
tara:strand:- start:262 stop:504 length:243 start_codon:yes stop_codon:yes gene_type:complete